MARIRSLHPEQFTDDDFVTCTALARLLALGIRNQADDNGIFEWNPVKLKMRVLPADNCDVPLLLTELVTSRQVLRFAVSGKEYGIIRNFQTFQRPKYPSFQHPTPPGKLPKGYELSERYSGKLTPDSDSDSGNADRPSPGDSGRPPPALPQPSRKVAAEESSGEESRKHTQLKRSASSSTSTEGAVAALRVLVEADKRITLPAKGRMHLGQWATEGVTPEQLTQAIRIARTRKPHPELIPFAYLVPIVGDVKAGKAIDPDEARGKDAIPEALERIRAREARDAAKAQDMPPEAIAPAQPQPTRAREPEPDDPGSAGTASLDEDRSTPADLGEGLPIDNPYADEAPLPDAGEELAIEDEPRWWEHPDRVMARAVELQVQVFDGEGFEDLTARVLAAMGPGPHTAELDPAFQERVQYFAAVGVNSDAARPQAN